MKILVVEDDPMLRDGLVDLLTGAEHEVVAVTDGAAGVQEGREQHYDLVVLDLMLPRLDGIEVCQRLRTVRPTLPILMLTARGAEEDKVRGLKAGADDYVTKPFGVRELLARVEAFERRLQAMPSEPEVVAAAGCRIDLGRCEAQRAGETITLTAREVGIVRWLYRHRERGVSRAELLENVWGTVGNLQTRTVDMTIAKLRQKIEEDPAHPEIITTVTGVGYRWAAGEGELGSSGDQEVARQASGEGAP
ncbi:MAG: response regulator transcription factor [Holophagales bacterium]|nr:response regulator transcription factor [Holophagales bacterium]